MNDKLPDIACALISSDFILDNIYGLFPDAIPRRTRENDRPINETNHPIIRDSMEAL